MREIIYDYNTVWVTYMFILRHRGTYMIIIQHGELICLYYIIGEIIIQHGDLICSHYSMGNL